MDKIKIKVLLVDDQVDFLRPLAAEIRDTQDWYVDENTSIADGINAALAGNYDVAMVDIVFPNEKLNGVDFLREVKQEHRDLQIILMTGYADVKTTIEALHLGAADYIKKPFDFIEAIEAIKRIFLLKKLEKQLLALSRVMKAPDTDAGTTVLVQNVLECAQTGFDSEDSLFWVTVNNKFDITKFSSVISNKDRKQIRKYVKREPLSKYINHVINTRKLFTISNVKDVEKIKDLDWLGSFIFLPVVIQNKSTALICAIRRKPGKFDNSDVQFLSTIADVASIEMDRYQQWYKRIKAERANAKKEKEKELAKIHAELEVYNTLLPGIAHYMHQPLMVIKGRTQKLLKTDNIEKQQIHKELSSIETNVKKIEFLIKDMLDLNKISRVNMQEGDLVNFIKQCVKFINEAIKFEDVNKKIEITLRFSNDIPSIKFDSQKLEMAINNLLYNAIQAVQMRIQNEPSYHGRIEIAVSQKMEEIVIEIKDNGIGITTEEQKKIFEPLYSSKSEGHGLGLAVARMIAVSHGGYIEFKSSSNIGSTFQLYLPVENV